MNYQVFKNSESLAQEFVALLKNKVLQHKGKFTIALSGGSTPDAIFRALAKMDDQSWLSQVCFFWGDERMVPFTDDQSNFGRANALFFTPSRIHQGQIFPIPYNSDARESVKCYEQTLQKQLSQEGEELIFDLILLGLGEDAHTASIFPHEINLWDAQAYCVEATHPETKQIRVSLTGRVINHAKEVVFLVCGASKAERIKELAEGGEQVKGYPASLVAPVSGFLTWYLDEAAAQFLPEAKDFCS